MQMVFCTVTRSFVPLLLQCRTPFAAMHTIVLLTMGIMMPETCWDNLIINIRLVASCSSLSLSSPKEYDFCGNHKILHRRQRFYELTCKRNTHTSNVTDCRKYATLFAKSTVRRTERTKSLEITTKTIFFGGWGAPPVTPLTSRNNFDLVLHLMRSRFSFTKPFSSKDEPFY